MAFPTDYRGKTMVQPDGSYKNTPIPASMKHKTSTREGGNYKRHWSQKKSEAQKKREAARKRG